MKSKYLFYLLSLFLFLEFTSGSLFLKSSESHCLSHSGNVKMFLKDDMEDSSGFSSDGPVVVYQDGKIISYSVLPEGDIHNVSIVEINEKDKLTCYVDETDQHFSFNLKDSISTESDVYALPEKMLIVSDIEGNFRGLSMILKGAGIVNDKFEWIFGNGHLIFAGDLFDRGVNVTECLWLIYKLESEAELQGGKVHFILGNHEMMNLRKDFRYVRNKYQVNADSLNLEYESWYSADSELGRWLRSKNSIEKIGDFLIMHAGISRDFPSDSLTITDINNNIRSSIDKHFNKGEASKDIFIGSSGPLWYRGIVNESETQNDIENTLSAYTSSKMILGHTIVDSMKYLYDRKVIAIDLEHQENSDKGIMYALWFENGNFFMIDNNGLKKDLE